MLRFMNGQMEFESLLNSTLKNKFFEDFQKINKNTAKTIAENLLKEHPEYQSSLKQIEFKRHYFRHFFKRYNWKWLALKGLNTYFPAEVEEQRLGFNNFSTNRKLTYLRTNINYLSLIVFEIMIY